MFERVEALYNQRDTLNLDAESLRLLEQTYTRFVRACATLNDSDKAKIRKSNEEHSTLTIQFSQNLLAESSNIAVVVEDEAELAGLSGSQIKTSAEAASVAGHEGKYLISIPNTTRQPVLASLENRALRQRV